MKRERGFTLIEAIVTVAIVGILIVVFAVSQREAISWHRTNQIDYFRLPDQSAVLTRLRRDVLDTIEYSGPFAGYQQTERTLLLVQMNRVSKERSVVVYDFTQSGKARRIEFLERDNSLISDWTANETPNYTIKLYDAGTSQYGVRLLGRTEDGAMVVEQILVPRA